jgi:hypothetical protein
MRLVYLSKVVIETKIKHLHLILHKQVGNHIVDVVHVQLG